MLPTTLLATKTTCRIQMLLRNMNAHVNPHLSALITFISMNVFFYEKNNVMY